MPSINQESQQQKTSKSIEDEISAYGDSSNSNNETFRIFSQSDHEDDEQPPSKKINTNNSGFNQIKSKANSSSANKFKETIIIKQSSVPAVTITPPLSIAETDLHPQTEADLESEGRLNILDKNPIEFFLFSNRFNERIFFLMVIICLLTVCR